MKGPIKLADGVNFGRRVPLLTEDELSMYLSKPKGTLRNWRYRGIGPKWHRLEGGDIRYRWPDVDSWLEEQAPGGSAA